MPESIDDLSKKYRATYIKYAKKLYYVKDFNNDNEKGDIWVFFWRDKDKIDPVLWDQDQVEEVQPDSCFFNAAALEAKMKLNQGARMFIRNPRRQWRRSLCEETGTISSPLRDLFQAVGKKIPEWSYTLDFATADALLSSRYPAIIEGTHVLHRAGAIAISPLYCLTLSTIGTNPLLCSTFGFIGEVVPKEHKIYIHHKPAYQEVQDLLSRTRQTQWRLDATN